MTAVEEEAWERSADDFAAVYDAHHRRLLRVAYLLRGDLSAAEDDVAEAFARTLPPWLEGRVHDVGAYLRTAVVNASRLGWRSAKRRNGWRPPLPPAVIPVEDVVSDQETLRVALDRLPRGQRVAVVLRYVDDLSERATAEAMGVSIGTVKSQVARGLASLRQTLEEHHR